MTLLYEDHANSLRQMGTFHRSLVALPWIALVCERIADYFDKSSWYLSHEPPGDVPYCQIRPILGGHYFGDFQSLRCQALSAQPYGVEPPGEHFPLVYFIHYAVSWMPITAGFLLLASFSVAIVVILVLCLSKKSGGEFVLVMALSLPVLHALDRGNLLWVIGLALMAWVVDGSHHWQRLAWVLLLSIKIQLLPALLLLLLHARLGTALKRAAQIIVGTLSLNLLPFLIFGFGDLAEVANFFVRTWRKAWISDFGPYSTSVSLSSDLLLVGAFFLTAFITLGWLAVRLVRARFRMRADTRSLLSGVTLSAGVMGSLTFASPRYGTAILCGVAIGLFTGSKGKQVTVPVLLCVVASSITFSSGLFGRDFLLVHLLAVTGGVLLMFAGFDARREEVSVGSHLRTDGDDNKRVAEPLA